MTLEKFKDMLKAGDHWEEFEKDFNTYYETHSKEGLTYEKQVFRVFDEFYKITYTQEELEAFCEEHDIDMEGEENQLFIIIPYIWWLKYEEILYGKQYS